MAARRIRVEVDGVAAVAELHDDLSPKMAEAFWSSLPMATALTPAKWSGQACFIHPDAGPLRDVTRLEHPVCSIYPGTIVARPGGSEVLIAYGPSEYRWAIGVDYVTPVATIVENRAAFLATLARTHDEGEKRVTIAREG